MTQFTNLGHLVPKIKLFEKGVFFLELKTMGADLFKNGKAWCIMKIMLIVGIFALLPICRSRTSGMQLVLDLF